MRLSAAPPSNRICGPHTSAHIQKKSCNSHQTFSPVGSGDETNAYTELCWRQDLVASNQIAASFHVTLNSLRRASNLLLGPESPLENGHCFVVVGRGES